MELALKSLMSLKSNLWTFIIEVKLIHKSNEATLGALSIFLFLFHGAVSLLETMLVSHVGGRLFYRRLFLRLLDLVAVPSLSFDLKIHLLVLS